MDKIQFTPIEQSIVDVLKDGQKHPKEQLRQFTKQNGHPNALLVHISNLRKKLRPHAMDIVLLRNQATLRYDYMLVRLIGNSE